MELSLCIIPIFIRRFIGTNYLPLSAKVIPNNLKSKKKSSQEWLTRQLNDPYVEKAKIRNYRCRSAFKLLELNEKHEILQQGDIVIDCGAAPGSWTQVAVEATNANGFNKHRPMGVVYSVDMNYFHPVKGAKIFGGFDFTKPETKQMLMDALGETQVNCVMSDMAPNATGVRMLDQENIMDLCYNVLAFSVSISARGGHLIMKFWDNGDVPKLHKAILHYYEIVKRVKPNASRADSAENYFVAKGFKSQKEKQKDQGQLEFIKK